MSLSTKEVIQDVATRTGESQAAVKRMLEALAESVAAGLDSHGEVCLANIGKLKTAERAARTGRNPQTGDPVQIAARTSVKFTVAKALKDAVN